MAFGKTFLTRKEASDYLKKQIEKGKISFFSKDHAVRRLSKRVFPRTKKRYHVGTSMDFLNWG